MLAVLGFQSDAFGQNINQSPRLVVNIAIDQLCSDFLEANEPFYCDDGLKKLLSNGLVFKYAYYPFTPVDHASAVATLATGAYPYYHGIVAEEWISRKSLRPVLCTNDEQFGHSPSNILSSTFGDELKISTQGFGRVYTFAPKATAAILSAGHAADGVAWLADGKWNTSPYYTKSSTWLNGYIRIHTPGADINRNITQIALDCIEQTSIGIDENTDYIYIEYTLAQATESLHQSSKQQLEGYLNIDREIATLINTIEEKNGKENVLFVITGTGYHREDETDDETRYRIPSGKLNISNAADLLNLYFGAVYGSGRYIDTHFKNHIFLNKKLFEQKNIPFDEALRQAQTFLLQVEGVRNVLTSVQLLTSQNPLWSNIRNGFYLDRCGDLIIEIAPGWKFIDEYTHHYPKYRVGNIPFPIIFYGAEIKAGKREQPVTVDQIAPTIAKCIRIRAPNACSALPLF